MTLQKGVIIIKGIPGCPPNRICELNCLDDVIGNADNLPYLLSMLQNNCIEAAALGGWNDHASYDLVLRSNGALAPYNSATNYANYAFCIEKGNGCNREILCTPVGQKHYNPCAPSPSPRPYPSAPCPTPIPCPPAPYPTPIPCPPAPRPHPAPRPCPAPKPCPAPRPCPVPKPCPKPKPCPVPRPCPPKRRHKPFGPGKDKRCDLNTIKCDDSSSSSSSSKSCSRSSSDKGYECSSSSSKSCSDGRVEKCPKYVKQKRTFYKNCEPRKRCEDRVNFAVENIKIVKTFIFNPHDLRNKRSVKFREITDKATNCFKWVELKPIFDGKKFTKDGYPALLRFPCFLYELRKYVSCKYNYPNPCLYLDCYGRLYVRIRECLYSINFRKSVKFTHKSAFKHIKLCPVKGRKLDCLIQSGLAGVLFEEKECY